MARRIFRDMEDIGMEKGGLCGAMKFIKFGGTPEEQDHLSELVKTGHKTATSSLLILQEISAKPAAVVGERWAIQDSEDNVVCYVKVDRVDLVPYDKITEAFALAEGDGSLGSWRRIHAKYYGDLLKDLHWEMQGSTMLECVHFSLAV